MSDEDYEGQKEWYVFCRSFAEGAKSEDPFPYYPYLERQENEDEEHWEYRRRHERHRLWDAQKFVEDIRNKDVGELRKPIEKLLFEIRSSIDRGEYAMIIGDDASGRIPTLIFDRILKSIYRKKGMKEPQTRFFAGSGSGTKGESIREQKTEALEKHIQNEMAKGRWQVGRGKILIVTDTIVTGNSLLPLADALHHLGIRYDIATIGFPSCDDPEQQEEERKELEAKLHATIFAGHEWTPSLYEHKEISGVQKNPAELFAKPRDNKVGYAGVAQREQMEIARRKAFSMANELVRRYEDGAENAEAA